MTRDWNYLPDTWLHKRQMSYEFKYVFRETKNEPTETGSRWIKTNNISCHCQLLHSSTSTAYTALHRPWHALAGTMNGCVIWRCSGHSPWWAVRLSYRNIWSIWHTVYEFVMNILLNSCSCISDVHPIVIMQPSCVLVPSCLLFYCTHTHTPWLVNHPNCL